MAYATSAGYEKTSIEASIKKMLEFFAADDHEGFDDSEFTPEAVFAMWKNQEKGDNKKKLLERFCSLNPNETPILPHHVVSFADAYVKRDLDPAKATVGHNGHGALLRIRSVCNSFWRRMGINNKWDFKDSLQTIGTGDIRSSLLHILDCVLHDCMGR